MLDENPQSPILAILMLIAAVAACLTLYFNG